MILLTLASTAKITSLFYTDAFVVGLLYSYTLADYWVTDFGAPDESVTTKKPNILNVRIDNLDYTEAASYAACLASERSWFLDDTGLYIHLDHDVVWDGVVCQYGLGTGYSDDGVIYVDDVQYLPIVTSFPSISKAQDIQGYDKIRLLSGTVTMANLDGRLDALKDQSVIGNQAIVSYLPGDKIIDGQASSVDVVEQFQYFVENAEYGAAEVSLELQDPRALDRVVPTRTLDAVTYPFLDDSLDGQLVPLIYGACRSVKCYPVTTDETGTTAATYRVAELLTSITEVRVKIDDTWNPVAVSSMDLANGTFTVAVARAGVGQAPYECQADVVGIPNTNAPDIIVDLYERFVNQGFNSTFYNTTEWTANKAGIPSIGLVIDQKKPILEIIPLIQNGCWPSFQFDIDLGKKTIRRDDRDRPIDWFVSALEVQNIDTLRVKESSSYLFGSVTVQYDKDYTEGTMRSLTDATHEQDVIENYQWSNTKVIETLLTNQTDAQVMLDDKALEFSLPISTLEPVLFGDRYFGVKVYDIMQIDTAMGRTEAYTGEYTGREYYGILVGQVLSVAPDYKARTTTLTLRILPRAAELETNWLIYDEFDEMVLNFEDKGIASYA